MWMSSLYGKFMLASYWLLDWEGYILVRKIEFLFGGNNTEAPLERMEPQY